MSDDLDFDMEVVGDDELDDMGADGAPSSEDDDPRSHNETTGVEVSEHSGSDSNREAASETGTASENREEKVFERGGDVEGWKKKTLGGIFDSIYSGGTPKKGVDEYYGGDLPFVKIEDLNRQQGKGISSAETHITEKAVEETSTRAFDAGTLLLTIYGSLAETALVRNRVATNQAILGLWDAEEENTLYVKHAIDYDQAKLQSLSRQTTQANLGKGIVAKHRLSVPPLPEQRKIASVLYAVDQAIQKTEAIIEQAQRVKRGLLEELMLRGTDGSGSMRPSPEEKPEAYVDKRRQRIPSDWKLTSLQDLCTDDVTYGIVQAGPHVEGGVPYVKTGDMTDGHLTVEDLSRTSSEIAEKYSRSRVEAGELIITIRATVGVVKQVPGELHGANLTQGTARIAPGPEVDNGFLLWAIRSNKVQSQIRARLKGTTFDEITLGQLRQILIPHPDDTDEQKRIADRMSSLEAEIDKERSSVDALGRLKKGLMQDLLTGEVRTADKAIDVLDEVVEHG